MMKYCALDIDFIMNSGATDDETVPVWDDYGLCAFPNPFNPTTQVAFELAAPGHVRVAVYNVRGRLVKTLTEGNLLAGSHTLTWNGADDNGAPVASGVYFARIEGSAGTQAAKLLLLK